MKNTITFLKTIVILLPVMTFLIYYNMRMEKERFKPHINTLPGGKVLVTEVVGDPDITLDTAGTTLYNVGRKLKLSPSYIAARHLTWNQRDTIPRENWVVHYSRMVPETATSLANLQDTANVKIYFDRREKTKIAQILHVGHYDDIPKSLMELRQFIDNKGYRLSGFYEEVYLIFEHIESNPHKYETLLRYQIAK